MESVGDTNTGSKVRVSPRTADHVAGTRATPGRSRVLAKWISRGGVFLAFFLMLTLFSLGKPESYPTTANLRTILDQAAVLAIVAAGLTVVLATGEFDLSFGATVGIAGSAAVLAMRDLDQGIIGAIVIALVVGAGVGTFNGAVIAYGKVPAFIATLAVASMITGIERAFTHNEAIYQGVSQTYVDMTRERLWGVPLGVLISLATIIFVWVLLDLTVFGRRIYALGGSEQAARLAGVRTERVKLMAFVVAGMCAGLGGVIVTSRAASSFSNSGVGLLLPAYAAAFLGASALGGRRFHPAGTYFGVVFMGALATGLIMLQYPPWTTDLIQGAVLVGAVLITRRGS